MKKILWVLVSVVVCCFVLSSVSHAGLINHNRRNKVYRPPAAAAPGAPSAVSQPDWMTNPPRVQNRSEQVYDANRDGRLQPWEVKRYLADVIREVSARGSFVINSEILRAYDKNGDGVISRYEIAAIQEDANQ